MPLGTEDYYTFSLSEAHNHAEHMATDTFMFGVGRVVIYQVHGGERYAVGRPRGLDDPAWADWIALYWYDNGGRSGVCI